MYTPIHLTLLALGAPLVLGSQDQAGPPVFSVSELSIQTYQPEHVPSYDLIDIVGGMVGRTFYLEERGGILGDSIDNMSLLGDSTCRARRRTTSPRSRWSRSTTRPATCPWRTPSPWPSS